MGCRQHWTHLELGDGALLGGHDLAQRDHFSGKLAQPSPTPFQGV